MPARRRRGSAVLSGLGATLGLVLLLVGVPLSLGVAVGWPLPHGVPHIADISPALQDLSYIPDRFWIGLAAVIAWLAWVQVAGAIVVELVAALAHRPTPNLRLLAAPARNLARRLVSSATLVGMLMASKPALAQPAPRPPAPVTVVVGSGAPPAPAAMASAGSALGVASSTRAVYVVETWEATRDCLWTIAERHLGDPLRWREIWELNRGRPQGDGATLAEPDVILPGWELVLPADAVGLTSVSVLADAPSPASTGVPATAAAKPASQAQTPTTASAPATVAAPTTVAVATTLATTPPTSVAAPAPTAVATTQAPAATTSPTAAPTGAPAAPSQPRGHQMQFGKAGAQALRYGMVGLPVMAASGAGPRWRPVGPGATSAAPIPSWSH